MYTYLVDRPASVPLAAPLFLHRLISSISAVSNFLFSASVVAPRLGILLRLNYPMKTPVANNYGVEHGIIVSNACLPLVVPGKKETPFLILQLTLAVEYPTDTPSRRYTTLCLVFQRNTMPPQVVFPLKSSLECHHHMRYAMIMSFLPEHVQALNYNQWNLLPLQRHAKVNCSECCRQLQFLLFFLIIRT